MRRWVSGLLVGVTVVAAACVAAAAFRTPPATAATGAGSAASFEAAPSDPQRAAPPARAASLRFPYEPEPEWLMEPTTNHWYGRRGAVVENVVIHYTVITYEQTLRAFNTPAS